MWPLAFRGVTPPPASPVQRSPSRPRTREQSLASRALTLAAGLLVAAVTLLSCAEPAQAQEERAPLTAWLEGVADSAQALAKGDAARGEGGAPPARAGAAPRGGG